MIRTVFGHSKLHPYLVRILNNASSRGITLPSKSYVLILNEVITDFDKNGFWNLLDTFYLFAGGENTTKEFKCINWINPTINFGSFGGDLTSAFLDFGLSGNATGSGLNANAVYFNSFRALNAGGNYSLNNASLGTLCYRQATSIVADITSYISTTATLRSPSLTPAYNINRINSTNNADNFNFSGTGIMILNRTATNSTNAIKKDVQTLGSALSTNINQNNPFTALQMGTPNNAISYHTNAGLSLMFTGQSIPYSVSQSVRATINEKYFRKLGLTEIA